MDMPTAAEEETEAIDMDADDEAGVSGYDEAAASGGSGDEGGGAERAPARSGSGSAGRGVAKANRRAQDTNGRAAVRDDGEQQAHRGRASARRTSFSRRSFRQLSKHAGSAADLD